jgi:hypothetical protein
MNIDSKCSGLKLIKLFKQVYCTSHVCIVSGENEMYLEEIGALNYSDAFISKPFKESDFELFFKRFA